MGGVNLPQITTRCCCCMLLRQFKLREAEAAVLPSLSGHPWTEAPAMVAYDEALIRQDARDVVLHQCPLNRCRELGAVQVEATSAAVSVPIRIVGHAFNRPCLPHLDVASGRVVCAGPPWQLRHTSQIATELTFLRLGPTHRRAPTTTPTVRFLSMAWTSRTEGTLQCAVQTAVGGTLRIVEVPHDDGRCVHRLVYLPALVKLAAAPMTDRAALVAIVHLLYYNAVVGFRKPDWIAAPAWAAWLARIANKGVAPTYDHLPPGVAGTLYDSLCLGLGAAACADAHARPLLQRGPFPGTVIAAAAALRAHVESISDADLFLEQYNHCEGQWLQHGVMLAQTLRAEAAAALAAAVSICGGGSSNSDRDPRIPASLPPRRLAAAEAEPPAARQFVVDAVLNELRACPAPWFPTASFAVAAWMRPHWAALLALPLVPCTEVSLLNTITGEVVGAEASAGTAAAASLLVPPFWQPMCRGGVLGSPVWLQRGEDVTPFPWDCRVVLQSGCAHQLAHAWPHPDAAVQYPWMLVTGGSGSPPPLLPDVAQCALDNSARLLAAAFNLPLYATLQLQDGKVVCVGPSCGSEPVEDCSAQLPSILAASWARASTGELQLVGQDGLARSIPCRPYRLALEAMEVDSVQFYPVRHGVAVPSLPLDVYDALLARREVPMTLCNVAGAAMGVNGLHWSPQPASVTVTRTGAEALFAYSPISPVHRPFILVSNAAGEVVQIVDELEGSILFRRAGFCSVPYCPHARAPTRTLCPTHSARVSASCAL